MERLRTLHLGQILAVLVLGGAALFYFDPGRYHFYPLCVFHEVTGLLCPGCGGLRAVHQLLHGNVLLAFRFNPLAVVCLPLVVTYLICRSLALRQGRATQVSTGTMLKWGVAFLLVSLIFGIWRNLPGSWLARLWP